MIEYDDSDDGLLAGVAIFAFGTLMKALPAMLFCALAWPMFAYTGRILGWPPFAPVVAVCVIGARMLYGAVQMYRTMSE